MRADELRDRAKAIRLPAAVIARDIKADQQTVHRAFLTTDRRCDSRSSTLDKIELRIIEDEKRQLLHLLTVFGKPELYDQIVPAETAQQEAAAA